MAEQPDLPRLGDASWLAALLDDALTVAEQAPRSELPDRLSLFDRQLHDALWARGLLLGDDSERPAPPIIVDSDAGAAFLQLVRFLLIEGARMLAMRENIQTHRHLVRWQLGALVAGLVGELGVAVVLEDAVRQRQLSDEDEARLFSVASHALGRRAYLLGNPSDGLPLHAAVVVVEARAFLRLAAAQLVNDGSLRRRSVRYTEALSRSKALFFELLAGAFAASETERQPHWPRIAARQLRALSLLPADRRVAQRALRSPRAPLEILKPLPHCIRALFVEQLVFAMLLARRWTPAVRTSVRDAALAVGLTGRSFESMEARSAAFLMQHERAALALAVQGERTMLDTALLTASDSMHEAAAGIAQEIRDAGELGVTLARLARGETLKDDERHRMREQLIDLAKVVPSLAIFAAPGGMLLLPLILKLLPFDLRPSAFQSRPPRAPSAIKPDAGAA